MKTLHKTRRGEGQANPPLTPARIVPYGIVTVTEFEALLSASFWSTLVT
ncbi:hypothetical protein [Edaphobacter aggregans]|nr:hypothetical protein [Edaphobacter aggregans]